MPETGARYEMTFRRFKPLCSAFDPGDIRYDIEREPCGHPDHTVERAIKGSLWTYHPCCEKLCPVLSEMRKVKP